MIITGTVKNASDGFTIADPSYEDSVKCQFRTNRIPKNDVFDVRIALERDVERSLTSCHTLVTRRIQKIAPLVDFHEAGLLCSEVLKQTYHDIGTDTASIFAGKTSTLDIAYPPIHTGGDGYIGYVTAFALPNNTFRMKVDGKMAAVPGEFYGFYAALAFDPDWVKVEPLADYLIESFEIESVSRTWA